MVRMFSYIDAGTGSMFIQAVIGVFLAGSVIFRTYLRKALGKLKIGSRKNIVDEEI